MQWQIKLTKCWFASIGIDSYYTHFYWNKVNTISGFQLFANYLREEESAVPGRHCYVYVVQQPAVYNQTQVNILTAA